LQATIAARIDRVPPEAKRTLSAAAVIGSRFNLDLLIQLGVEPVVTDLVAAQLIDQVRFTRQPEYVFHHPLIRAVAYEAQLKADRAELHRRVAAAIESRDPAAGEENAALIAEHLEAAGDLHAAYGWHMRAATWATNRDIGAAQLSWERARKIADALPTDDPGKAAMRIAARTMSCGTAFRVHEHMAGARFDELRELCTDAGENASLRRLDALQLLPPLQQRQLRGLIGMLGHPIPCRCRNAIELIIARYRPTLTRWGDNGWRTTGFGPSYPQRRIHPQPTRRRLDNRRSAGLIGRVRRRRTEPEARPGR
jgi:hypothetical protein